MVSDNTLKIAVCDNTESDCKQITEMTAGILQEADVLYSISEYEDGRTLLSDIQNGTRFNVLLLDVMMDEMSGMELAAQLRRQQNKAIIIFISSNREMALCGYEVAAARYLAKPLDEEKVKEAMQYCVSCLQEQKEILLPTARGQYRTSFSEIQFVEAFERGTRFYLEKATVDAKLKFSEAQAILPQTSFILCHRAYIVNVSHIKRIHTSEFEMKSGASVPISKYRYNEVSQKFFDYISD